MKAIGIIVLVLVVSLGVGTYFITKEPNRELDAQGRSWVSDYQSWHTVVLRQVETAQRGMTLETAAKNARLLEPLRGCAQSLGRVGQPPELLDSVLDAAFAACGQADVALSKNDQFGVSALATTRLHLNNVEDNLRLSQHNLRLALDQPL